MYFKAVTPKFFVKKILLEILQNSQENACVYLTEVLQLY